MKKIREMLCSHVYEYPVENQYVGEIRDLLEKYDITHEVSDTYYIPGFDTFRIIKVYITGNIWLVIETIDKKLEMLRKKESKK